MPRSNACSESSSERSPFSSFATRPSSSSSERSNSATGLGAEAGGAMPVTLSHGFRTVKHDLSAPSMRAHEVARGEQLLAREHERQPRALPRRHAEILQ